MIVRLTMKMRDELRAICTPLHETWLGPAVTRVSALMVECSMPPIGWKTLQELGVEVAFSERGYRKKGQYETVGAALRRISKELAALERQPAFRHEGAPGWSWDMFLAWQVGPWRWSPYPVADVEPVLLTPVRRQNADGVRLTSWSAVKPAYHKGFLAVYQPEEHLAFLAQPAIR